MNEYDSKYLSDYGMEFYILSCIVISPELINNVFLEDKFFVEHKRLWIFMKAFYEKFKTFDTKLMRTVCKDKFQMSNYIQMMADCGPIHKPTVEEFNKYQERLKEMYYESKKDVWIIEKIYELSNRLYARSITLEEFKSGLNDIYIMADEVFKKEGKNVIQ